MFDHDVPNLVYCIPVVILLLCIIYCVFISCIIQLSQFSICENGVSCVSSVDLVHELLSVSLPC